MSPVPYDPFPDQPQPRGEYFVKSAHFYLELWRRRLVAIDPRYTIRVNVALQRGCVKFELDWVKVFRIRTASAQELKDLYIAFRLLDDNFQQLNDFVTEVTATEGSLLHFYYYLFLDNVGIESEGKVIIRVWGFNILIVIQQRANRLQ